MIAYAIFQGISTSTGRTIPGGLATTKLNDIFISKIAGHKKAAKRYAEYYVKGRDGALHVDEGYANFDIEITLVLCNAGAKARQIVNAWADGIGKLILSDDLTKCYRATVEQEVKWTRMAADEFAEDFSTTVQYYNGDFVNYDGNFYKFNKAHKGAWAAADADRQYAMINGLFDTAKIIFNCQPFMFESVDSTVEMIAGQGSADPGGGSSEVFYLTNQGTAEAYPLIKVQGTDTEAIAFDFCGEYIIIRGIDPNDPVVIDCDAGYIYTESGQPMTMEGNIPVIPMGTSGVYFNPEHSPTKITVTPRWRWI